MDLQTLSRLLKDLITVHDRVSLPGLGGFVTELAPSVFSDKAMVINPPFRRVLFKSSETWNDELLENLYADENDISVEEARKELALFLRNFKSELNKQKSVVIPGFGIMRATDQLDYFFVADKDLFIYPDSYGLEPLNVKILQKKGTVEVLSGKKTSLPPQPTVKPAYQSKPSSEKREQSVPAPKAQPVKREKPVNKGKKKKTNIWSVLFVFLLLIIIVVALMVVFKDEARPIWEWLLYSREERELLRQMGQGL